MGTLGRNSASAKPRPGWRVARLRDRVQVASDVVALSFGVADWVPHLPGQHYEVALNAPDGYRAVRNYSVASEPERRGELEFGVQLVPEGEVSPYLYGMGVGEEVEVRGPLGGYFNWDVSMPGSLILVGGGSGVVPLLSMIRHARRQGDGRSIALAVSAKTSDRIPYRDELDVYAGTGLRLLYSVTREVRDGGPYHSGRLDMPVLGSFLGGLLGSMPMVHVCGPNQFVESVVEDLQALGFGSHAIKTERFGA